MTIYDFVTSFDSPVPLTIPAWVRPVFMDMKIWHNLVKYC